MKTTIPSSPLLPGARLADQRYRLHCLLLIYPFTTQVQERLWVAEDGSQKRPVLLHELALPLALTEQQRAIRVLTQLRVQLASALAPVEDFFVEQGQLCFVTRMVKGRTLAQRVRQGACSEEETLTLGLDLCDLLALLAQHGSFHGALSPACVIQTPSGRWSVTHLPLVSLLLARQLLVREAEWSFPLLFPTAREGSVQGDLDALIAQLFFGMTGMMPHKHASPPLRALAGQIAGDVHHLFTRGFDPLEAQRYQSLGELRRDLHLPVHPTRRSASLSPPGHVWPSVGDLCL